MKRKDFMTYCIILAILFLTLPATLIILNRIFLFSNGELLCLFIPTAILLFSGLVIAGLLAEKIKD